MTDSDKIKLADEILKKVGGNANFCGIGCYYIATLDHDTGECFLFREYIFHLNDKEFKFKRCPHCIDLIGGIE